MSNISDLTLKIMGEWYADKFEANYNDELRQSLLDEISSRLHRLNGSSAGKFLRFAEYDFARKRRIETAKTFFKKQFEQDFSRVSYDNYVCRSKLLESAEPFNIFIQNAIKLFNKRLPQIIDADDLDVEFIKTFESVECFMACYHHFIELDNVLIVMEESKKQPLSIKNLQYELNYISIVAESYTPILKHVFKDLT